MTESPNFATIGLLILELNIFLVYRLPPSPLLFGIAKLLDLFGYLGYIYDYPKLRLDRYHKIN
jgi:hypothetical protein